MKALVTGRDGFIGCKLIETLVDDYEVAVLDNFHTGSRDNLAAVGKDMMVIKGPCNDCLSSGLMPDIIFHFGIPSSLPHVQDESPISGRGDQRHIAIMRMARQVNSKKAVFA